MSHKDGEVKNRRVKIELYHQRNNRNLKKIKRGKGQHHLFHSGKKIEQVFFFFLQLSLLTNSQTPWFLGC